MEEKYAGFWRRFLANWVDGTLILYPTIGIISLFKILSYDFDPNVVMPILVGLPDILIFFMDRY